MEVPFTCYTTNYLTVYSEMICSLLSKWHYLSAHSDFGFFSCVGYLNPKNCMKGVKNMSFNFVGYMKHRALSEFLLIPFLSPNAVIGRFGKY